MSSYNIALNFEDGVTRFVECKAGEKVLDAAFRAKINLPMDCSDGVCGTCKCRAESGSLRSRRRLHRRRAERRRERKAVSCSLARWCRSSDCVIAVPASSTACKTEQSKFAATVAKVEPHNDAAVVLELDVDAAGRAGIPAGPVREHRRAGQRPASLVFVLVRAGRNEDQFSDQEDSRWRDEHVARIRAGRATRSS